MAVVLTGEMTPAMLATERENRPEMLWFAGEEAVSPRPPATGTGF
jgi:hypothetical protein